MSNWILHSCIIQWRRRLLLGIFISSVTVGDLLAGPRGLEIGAWLVEVNMLCPMLLLGLDLNSDRTGNTLNH